MRGRKIIPIELAELCYAVGHGYAEMARRFGVSRPAVYFAIHPGARYGESAEDRYMKRKLQAEHRAATRRPRKGRHWSKDEDERLVHLHTREGKTIETIARTMHRTVGSVASRIRRLKAKGVL